MIPVPASGVAFLLCSAVIVFFDWVPTPLNRNIHSLTVRERLPSTVIHSVTGLAFASAALLGWIWVVVAAVAWYAVVLFAALRNWWLPYLVGTGSAEVSEEDFARHYGENTSVLPRRSTGVIVPDLQHCIIHASIVLAFAVALTLSIAGLGELFG
ncbi:hypothetical protein [Herbiconiux sp. YIM B11900]|uniref:hypothetical protein n=1 Tax=Herbiconiux sp. YIM B11900 TaxID=3404131 RepID=UPI003F82C841